MSNTYGPLLPKWYEHTVCKEEPSYSTYVCKDAHIILV